MRIIYYDPVADWYVKLIKNDGQRTKQYLYWYWGETSVPRSGHE